jgi:hypothetical protein
MTNREPAAPPDTNDPADARHDAVSAAQARADDARERARAARRAAEHATTEYARRSNHRTADLHAELAVSHEDFARRVRFGGGREGA